MASLHTRGSPAPSVSSDGSSYSPPSSQVRRKPVPLNPIPSPRLSSLSIEDISTSIPPPGARPPSLSSLEGSFISPRNSNRYAWSHIPRIANARPPLFFSFGSNKEKEPQSTCQLKENTIEASRLECDMASTCCDASPDSDLITYLRRTSPDSPAAATHRNLSASTRLPVPLLHT